MPARRCSLCSIDWPLLEAYKKCPSCLERTSPVSNIKPLSDSEAKSMKANFEFERYYEEWDSKQPQERLDTGNLPDTILEIDSSG